MAKEDHPLLPDPVRELFDGRGLREKVGATALLSACDPDGWPRLALLSVGEVLAVTPGRIRLALYPGSRTTRALAASSQCLLTVVVQAAVHKIDLRVTPLDLPPRPDVRLAAFDGEVVACAEDEVGYARVLHGIEYELLDAPPVLARWERQLDWLRADLSGEHGA